MRKIAGLVITALALLNFTPINATAADISECKIPSINRSYHQDVGWPRDPDAMPSTGVQKILITVVDFPDAPADADLLPNLEKTMELEHVMHFYESVSSGNLDLQFDVYPKVIRLAKPSTAYGNQISTDVNVDGEFGSHRIIDESLASISNNLVLQQYAASLTVVAAGASLSGTEALALTENPSEDEISLLIHNYILVGHDAFNLEDIQPWRMIVHEINHLLGVTDLYLYADDGWWQGKSPGPFGQQGYLRGDSASDTLAYNRWLKGWIKDSQIKCITNLNSSMILNVQAQDSVASNFEMVIYRLDQNRVLVFETPCEKGHEALTYPRSLLIYTVDNSIPVGEGPVRIIPKINSVTGARLSPSLPDWERYQDAALLAGESVKFRDLVIVNTTVATTGDVVNFQILVGKDAQESTIKCVKRKVVAKVTGYQPRCPFGYRKR